MKVLFVVLALSSTAYAERYAPLVERAAIRCRTDATALRTQAAACREHSTPDETGAHCTAVSLAGRAITPDEADALAAQFDTTAPTLDAGAKSVAALEAAADKTTEKIKALGFEKRNEDYARWLELSATAREELAHETMKFAIARALDAPEQVERAIARLSRGRAEKIAAGLASYGEPGIELGKQLVRLARISGRRERAEQAALVIRSLHTLYDESKADGVLEGLLPLAVYVGELSGLEGLGFVVDEVQWATAAVYAFAAGTVASDEIDRLTEMHVKDLRALKSLTELLQRQVARIDDAVGALPTCQ